MSHLKVAPNPEGIPVSACMFFDDCHETVQCVIKGSSGHLSVASRIPFAVRSAPRPLTEPTRTQRSFSRA